MNAIIAEMRHVGGIAVNLSALNCGHVHDLGKYSAAMQNDDKTLNTLAGRVRTRRQELRYSQTSLARLVPCDPSTISKIESGDQHTLGADMLGNLSRALEVNESWLRARRGPKEIGERLALPKPADDEGGEAPAFVVPSHDKHGVPLSEEMRGLLDMLARELQAMSQIDRLRTIVALYDDAERLFAEKKKQKIA